MINRTLNREPPAWYVCQLTIPDWSPIRYRKTVSVW